MLVGEEKLYVSMNHEQRVNFLLLVGLGVEGESLGLSVETVQGLPVRSIKVTSLYHKRLTVSKYHVQEIPDGGMLSLPW